MEIYYCDKWSNIKRSLGILLMRMQPRHFMKIVILYTAVLSDGEQPKYLVNVTEKWVSVSF